MRVLPRGSPREVELNIRVTDVRKQKDGRWVYVYSHESLSPMAMMDDPGALRNE
jgi:hypothetical protein